MSSIPKDANLYEKIKKEITDKYKPSAYRSGLLVKKYKQEYYKKHHSNDAYIGTKPKLSNLERWFAEKWRNSRGEVGYKYQNDIYRPTIRINKDSPITFSELTKQQITKAQKEKKNTGRVRNFKLL